MSDSSVPMPCVSAAKILGMIVDQALPVRVGLVLVSEKDVEAYADGDGDGDMDEYFWREMNQGGEEGKERDESDGENTGDLSVAAPKVFYHA